jgi:hypothetical protein
MVSTFCEMPSLDKAVHKTYMKIIPAGVTGLRFFNDDPNSIVTFVLMSEDGTRESYIKIYSEQEDRYFKKVNHYLFDQGLIQEVKSIDKGFDDSVNVIDDAMLKQLGILKDYQTFVNTIPSYTSPAPVFKVLESCILNDSPNKIVVYVQDLLMKLGIAESIVDDYLKDIRSRDHLPEKKTRGKK